MHIMSPFPCCIRQNKSGVFKNTWLSFFFGMITDDSSISIYGSNLWKFSLSQWRRWCLDKVKYIECYIRVTIDSPSLILLKSSYILVVSRLTFKVLSLEELYLVLTSSYFQILYVLGGALN